MNKAYSTLILSMLLTAAYSDDTLNAYNYCATDTDCEVLGNTFCCATWSCSDVVGAFSQCTPQSSTGTDIQDGASGSCDVACSNGQMMQYALGGFLTALFNLLF